MRSRRSAHRPSRRSASRLVAAALSLTAAGTAGGQEAGPDDEAVEEYVVIGEPRPAMDVLAGATTDRIETDERLVEGALISDILGETPGVQVRRFGGVGERFEISIRGSRPEQVPVFLDGVRLDTSLTGRSDLSNLCLDVLQEVQITRGAGAARAGTGAIGGVVNLVARRAPAEPETRLRFSGGSFDTFEGSVRHARRMGPWEMSGGYCGFHTEGDFDFQQVRFRSAEGIDLGDSPTITRINNEAERHTGLARITREVGGGRLRALQFSSYISRGTPGSSLDQRPRAHERDFSNLTSVGFEHPVAALPRGRLDLGAHHRYERNRFRDPDPSPGRDPIEDRTEVQGMGAHGSLESEIRALAGRHRGSLLAEVRRDTREARGDVGRSRNGVALRAELESRWWADRLSIAPSLRFERYEGLDEEWIPSLGLSVEPLDILTLRGAIARSYRVPSFTELYLPDKGFERGNPDLRPEKSWSWEVGALLESPFASPWLDGEVEAVWFASEIDNSIAFQLISATTVQPRNTGRAETRGYELSARWRPHPWIRLSGSRTVTKAEEEKDGTRLPGIAYSQTDARLELGPRDRFKLVGELHYAGKIPVAAGDRAFLPSRTTWDASASIDLARIRRLGIDRIVKSLWLSLRGRNLSNEPVRDTQFFPRPGRNFALAIEGVL